MINRYIVLLFCFSLLIIGCNKYQFNIKFHNENEYKKVNDLINEIYDNAVNKNAEYFMKTKKIDSNTIEESSGTLNVLRLRHNKLEYTDKEMLEYYYTLEITSIMEEIIRSKLNKTYKKHAVFARDAINFDYYFNDKIHYQIYISKDENGNWFLADIFLCR
jgi:hypothetical protein